MERTQSVSRELKGLLAAIVAGLAAVGICYGLSAALAPAPGAERPHHTQRRSSGGDAPVSAALVSQGTGLYAQACASCHGGGGVGGYGPRLVNTDQSGAQITAVIVHGVTGKMPAFGGKYSPAQIQAMVAYVQSLKK